MQKLKLNKIEINEFKGLSGSLLLPIGEQSSNIVIADGDGGVGKSSFLQSIYYSLGGNFNIPIEKFINRDSGEIDTNVEFEYKEELYRVRTTKTQFVLEKLREDEKWAKESSPKSLVNTIFKKAILPSGLYEADGKKQLEWFLELFELPKEDKAQIKQIEATIDNMAKITRPQIGRDMKGAKAIVVENILYKEYLENNEQLETKIVSLKSTILESGNLAELSAKATQHTQAFSRLEILKAEHQSKKNEIENIEKQIYQLTLKAESAENEVTNISAKIIVGEQFIIETAPHLDAYNKALEQQSQISENTSTINSYNKLLLDIEKQNKLESDYADIDSQIVQAKAQLKEYKASVLPCVEGLELITDEFNEESKDIGLYIGDLQMNQVNESKFMEIVIKAMAVAGAKFIFIENISSYGTKAIAYLEQLAKEIDEHGGWIFATKMDRTKDKLTINFKENLE